MITVRSKAPTATITVSSTNGGKKVLLLKESVDQLTVSVPRVVNVSVTEIRLPQFSELPDL